MSVLFYLKPDGQYILTVDDGMALFLFIVIMFSVMIDGGRSFYLKSDEQYIFDSDAMMAVFLFTIILCEVLIDSGRSFLFKTR